MSAATGNCLEQVLGLFDVLGFSERVRRRSLAEVYAEYERLIEVAKNKNGSLCIGKALRGDGYYSPAVGWLRTEHAYFSDTVLIWSRFDDSRYAAFCSLCATLVCEALMIAMPLRGAISVGEAVLDKATGTYVGAAVVEAADVEKAQMWLGVSFTPSAAKRIQGFDPRLVLPYCRHRKEGAERLVEGAVLDWPRQWRENQREDLISTLRQLEQSLGSHPYIEAAIEFAAYSERHHDWFYKRQHMGISDP